MGVKALSAEALTVWPFSAALLQPCGLLRTDALPGASLRGALASVQESVQEIGRNSLPTPAQFFENP
jgi:hypothetical protein